MQRATSERRDNRSQSWASTSWWTSFSSTPTTTSSDSAPAKSADSGQAYQRLLHAMASWTVENDGESDRCGKAPRARHVLIPQLIFGELLTSTELRQGREEAGRWQERLRRQARQHLRQAATASVSSIAGRALSYDQTFHDNMTRDRTRPKVKASKGKSTVCLRWLPDYARFGYAATRSAGRAWSRLIERRVYDLAMTVGKEVKVTWNGDTGQVSEPARTTPSPSVARLACCTRLPMTGGISSSPQLQRDGFFQLVLRQRHLDSARAATHVDAVTDQIVSHVAGVP
jgi:hypothetical protein